MSRDDGTDDFTGRILHDTYRILRKIAEGGMGEVFEAEHVRLTGRRFAIKILGRAISRIPEVYARFRREAEITSRMGHPNIVDVLDFYETEEGRPYLVMEHLEGEDLATRLARAGALHPAVASEVLRQVGEALTAAHALGVVHRDMKPENIFLTVRDGMIRVKVLDFGISKIRDSKSVVTRDLAVLGTPYYMSPEQGEGSVKDIDHTTDIFALGTIAYQALCNQLPFDAPTIPGVVYKICHVEPVPLSRILPWFPEAGDAVLARALAKAKTARYPQASAFVGELCPLLDLAAEGLPPVEAEPDPPAQVAVPASVTEDLAPAPLPAVSVEARDPGEALAEPRPAVEPGSTEEGSRLDSGAPTAPREAPVPEAVPREAREEGGEEGPATDGDEPSFAEAAPSPTPGKPRRQTLPGWATEPRPDLHASDGYLEVSSEPRIAPVEGSPTDEADRPVPEDEPLARQVPASEAPAKVAGAPASPTQPLGPRPAPTPPTASMPREAGPATAPRPVSPEPAPHPSGPPIHDSSLSWGPPPRTPAVRTTPPPRSGPPRTTPAPQTAAVGAPSDPTSRKEPVPTPSPAASGSPAKGAHPPSPSEPSVGLPAAPGSSGSAPNLAPAPRTVASPAPAPSIQAVPPAPRIVAGSALPAQPRAPVAAQAVGASALPQPSHPAAPASMLPQGLPAPPMARPRQTWDDETGVLPAEVSRARLKRVVVIGVAAIALGLGAGLVFRLTRTPDPGSSGPPPLVVNAPDLGTGLQVNPDQGTAAPTADLGPGSKGAPSKRPRPAGPSPRSDRSDPDEKTRRAASDESDGDRPAPGTITPVDEEPGSLDPEAETEETEEAEDWEDPYKGNASSRRRPPRKKPAKKHRSTKTSNP